MRVIPKTLTSISNAGPNIERELISLLQRTGSITALWLCTDIALRKRAEKRDLQPSQEFADICLSLLESRAERYRRDTNYEVTEASEEIASYLLAAFVITDAMLAHASLRLMMSSAARSLLGFGRNEVDAQSKRRKMALHPLTFEFLDRLSRNALVDRVDVSWVYKYLRSKCGNAPFIKEWTIGETIRIPNHKLTTEVGRSADTFELDAVLKEFRARTQGSS